MCKYLFLFLSVFSVGLSVAHATDINRCVQTDGTSQFTNQPCPEGIQPELLDVVENSPLDSRAVRASMARHEKQSAANRHGRSQEPDVVFIRDTYTEERNARISGKSAKKKNKGKKKKKRKNRKKKTGVSREAGSQPSR
jgi:hypothetical protein